MNLTQHVRGDLEYRISEERSNEICWKGKKRKIYLCYSNGITIKVCKPYRLQFVLLTRKTYLYFSWLFEKSYCDMTPESRNSGARLDND